MVCPLFSFSPIVRLLSAREISLISSDYLFDNIFEVYTDKLVGLQKRGEISFKLFFSLNVLSSFEVAFSSSSESVEKTTP